MIHGHGGNIREAAANLGCEPGDITDMSSNINPLGPPPGLVEHLSERLQDIVSLPEVDAGRIVEGYAKWQGLDPGGIVPGNGTTQLL
ncbi:MAG: pyridoxal phosphate-dependent class II aminotransferase, partial [Desulfatibacillaceae bacterium]